MTTRRLKATFGGFLFAIALAVPATAMADDYVGPETPKVKGEEIARPQTQAQPRQAPVQVQGDTASRGLPITGADVLGLTAIGIASVGVGTVLVRRSRRTA